MDLTINLNSLSFESGLSGHEKESTFLRSRSAGLTVCGCGHAAFLCSLAASVSYNSFLLEGFPPDFGVSVGICVHSFCRAFKWSDTDVGQSGFLCRLAALAREKLKHFTAKADLPGLNVGVLGGGRVGTQLVKVLLTMPGFKASNISVSTRRPETLKELLGSGVECYFDNRRLAAWADVLFLCVLPSQLPRVSSELRSHLGAHCLVYSFTSAMPLRRLALLLGHRFVLKPQYDFAAGDSAQMWLRHNQVTTALKDDEVLTASFPFSMSGGFSLDHSWVCGVLYSLINMCTTERLESKQAVQLLNEVFETKPSAAVFTCQSFVNSSCSSTLVNSEKPFPWINLIDAQTKQTPLSSCLLRCKVLQDCISAVYHKTFSGLSHGKQEMKG